MKEKVLWVPRSRLSAEIPGAAGSWTSALPDLHLLSDPPPDHRGSLEGGGLAEIAWQVGNHRAGRQNCSTEESMFSLFLKKNF